MKHPVPMARPPHDAPVHDQGAASAMETQRLLAGLMADLADSVNGLTLRGARAVPVGTAPHGTLRVLASGAAGRLMGWSLRESSGTAGVLVRIFDGHDANDGTLLATIPLAAAAATVVSPTKEISAMPAGGISITDGCIIVLSDPVNVNTPATGTVEGSIWLGAAE